MSSEDKPWQNEELLRRKYWDKGMSTVELGDLFDCTSMTIHYWMEKYDIPRRDNGRRENAPWKDKETLENLYCDVGLGTAEMADMWGCDNSNISYWLKKHNIEINQYEAQRAPDELYNESYLEEKYVDGGLSSNEIADELDVCHTTVLNALEREGIDRRATSHRGEKHWNWKGGINENVDYGPNWDQQRSKAIERDGGICQDCGVHRSELSCGIHVHHILPKAKFVSDGEFDYEKGNKLRNLVTLCPACHRRWEGLCLKPDRR